MAITIKPIANGDVLAFWEDSPHSSIFTHPIVLQTLSKNVDWWIAEKGNQPQCLWPVCSPDGQQIGIPELTYYVGPLWAQDVYPLPGHRSLARTTEVYEGFIKQLLLEYGEIHACFPKGLIDMRVFDWWNYHQKDQPRFNIRPRYTACIDDLHLKSEADIVAGFRQLRRRELRAMLNQTPPPRSNRWTTDDLIRLYMDVVDDQDSLIKNMNCEQIPAFVELVQKGFGEVIAFQDPASQRIISACLLLFSAKEANMVFNLVDNDWRSTGLAAWMIKESILTAQSKGMVCFDFNGANSPNRGDDKHSYGAMPVLYFEIKYPGGTYRD
jgi:hypothetical protein